MPPSRIAKALLLIVACLFVLSVLLVCVMRWVNPPVTAYMLETRAQLSANAGHPVHLEHRWVALDHIAGTMCLAAVSSEDQTFPTNHGFDWKAIKKAIRYNEHHQHLHGASTITQQTAKNIFLWSGKSYFRKALGAYFTVLIDVLWPKRRVLEVYLNIAQFDNRVFGVSAAARHFFGTSPAHLSAPQAALLAATLPAPDSYSVSDPSHYMRRRQHWILRQMRHLGGGYLTSVGIHAARLPARTPTTPSTAPSLENPLTPAPGASPSAPPDSGSGQPVTAPAPPPIQGQGAQQPDSGNRVSP